MTDANLASLLTVDEAIQIIDATPVRPRVVELPLAETQGLRLAEDILADRDYPPFDKSLMDGFAVRTADLIHLPAELKLNGEIAAGQQSHKPLQPGQAAAIMTGAPLPPGADGVVPVEDALTGQCTIRVAKSADWSRYISRQGSDIQAGRVILSKGIRLEAGQLAAAAMVGAARVPVFAAPRVAVLATGDEIVPYDQTPGPSQIRNSNTIMILSLLRRLGCHPTDLGWVPDQPQLIRDALLRGIQADVLFVTGGMSMGRHDHVPRLLQEIGVDMKIAKLRIKPGKPFVFGTAPTGCHVFGLPGNPISGFVCTTRLASRLLTRLAGGAVQEQWITGKLLSPLGPNGAREFYQPVIIEYGPTALGIRPLDWKGSADLSTLAQANALMVRPENQPPLAAGTPARAMMIT